jgi:SEC-C motif
VTLLIALANDRTSLLVADRRITRDGQLVEDEFNKICVFLCEDARLTMAFTGLARIGAFDTSEWLCAALREIGERTGCISEVLHALGLRARDKLRILGASGQKLTILASGFTYWSEIPQPIVYVLSNTECAGASGDEFTLRTVSPNDGVILEIAGATSTFPAETELKLRSLAAQRLDDPSLLRFAVKALQNASRSGGKGNLIGSQCNSAIVPAARDTTVRTTYHSHFHTFCAFGPNVVVSGGLTVYGTEIQAGQILAGPRIGKKAPCWCGSGLRFRECHLRKFGSIYVRHQMFTVPMTPFTGMTFDVPRASGSRFYVAGCID